MLIEEYSAVQCAGARSHHTDHTRSLTVSTGIAFNIAYVLLNTVCANVIVRVRDNP